MSFTAKDIKELRERTGAGMMDCKKALKENDGEMEKAIDFLRAKGLAAAAKKQSRIAAEGLVFSQAEGSKAVALEVNCETDFVAKGDDFKNFCTKIASLILANNPADIDALKALTFEGSNTVADSLSELTLKIGEKIDVRRFTFKERAGNGGFGTYVHGGKIAVLVNLTTEADVKTNEKFQELLKDLTMHVAAANPVFINSSDIDEDYTNREAEVYAAQLKEQGKPESMIPNIVKGKLNKLASEICLLEQKFVKDPDVTIKKLIENVGKEVGTSITITEFVKLNLGEGIEKKNENFADEIAKMTNQ
ncbi:translation elongation factor Ts [Bacteriovoracaceae bacterium]|nr:translation elongation factor Ts [Bacteriovoracaceae bacterium]